ncbi:MAG: flagellar associated, partial [Trebouxia sp. A1-2]
GAQIKTRKRNIAVPLDPGSFADAVVQIFQDSKEGDDLEKNLQAAVLESVELDFSRYGETLFEVLFAGGRMAAGGNVVSEKENKRLDFTVMSAGADRESILPYIKMFQQLIRRRPFLIKSLENTLSKLLKSLDFYDNAARHKVAIATARVFSMKIGVLPDRVLMSLINDRMIAKGTILDFITAFFKDYLATDSMDDLAEGLTKLVEHNNKKVAEKQLEGLKTELTEMITQDPPTPVDECLAAIKAKKAEFSLADSELVKIIFTVLIDAISTVGKNGQQILSLILKQIKINAKLLTSFTTSGRVESSLINHVQVYCYEDSKLLKLFSQILRILYDADVLGEDAILFWYKKGSHPKGRNVFLHDVEPFIKWLEEAEEEGEEEE